MSTRTLSLQEQYPYSIFCRKDAPENYHRASSPGRKLSQSLLTRTKRRTRPLQGQYPDWIFCFVPLTKNSQSGFESWTQALPELAYSHKIKTLALQCEVFYFVRVPGLEPGTSSLSVTRSNHLSYTRIPQKSSFVSKNVSENRRKHKTKAGVRTALPG